MHHSKPWLLDLQNPSLSDVMHEVATVSGTPWRPGQAHWHSYFGICNKDFFFIYIYFLSPVQGSLSHYIVRKTFQKAAPGKREFILEVWLACVTGRV